MPGFVDAFCQIAGTAGGPEISREGPPGEAATEWAGRLLAGGATCLMVSVRTNGNLTEDKERLTSANMLKQELPLKIVTGWTVGPDAGISPHDGEGKSALREIAQYLTALSVIVGSEGFTPNDARKICSLMGTVRKRVRLHGGPDLPADVVRAVRPVAVQDMRRLDEWTLQALRTNGGTVVLQPMFSLGAGRLPIQELKDRGIPVALGTGCLPGDRAVTSMPFLAWVASETAGVSIETALWCATYGGALAVGDKRRGVIRRGAVGDLAVLDVADFHELANHPDLPMVWELIREGDLTAVGQLG